MIHLGTLVAFYPYESVHTTNAFITIEDNNHEWYNAICALLKKYKISQYHGCQPGYFNLDMDNKITIAIHSKVFNPSDDNEDLIYITYWDNQIYISTRIARINTIGDMKWASVIKNTERNV